MKLVRTAYVRTQEIYELDLDEELAHDIETRLKADVIDPETVPHISAQTLAQCWEDEGPKALLDYQLTFESYSGKPYTQYLTEAIHDILNDYLWGADPYQADSDTDDWDDELECNDWREIDGPNPDFPDGSEEKINHSPESANDNE